MYKTSSYNYFVENENRIIYFNGISTSSFSVSQSEHEKMQELLGDLISFEINYNSVFNFFINRGFVIDESIDEIDVIRYRNKQAVFQDKSYNLVINPTLECNFKCWYCYENHPKGFMSKEIIECVKRHIEYKIEKERIAALHISWFGGEPLLYFDDIVYPISLYAKEICRLHNLPFKNSVTTNASRVNFEMIDRMNEISLNHFQITLDGAPNRHNKIRNENGIPSFNLIMENVIDICRYIIDSEVTLRINYDEKTLKDKCLKDIFEIIPLEYRSKITPNFQRVWQTVKADNQENIQRIELYNHCNNLGFNVCSPANVFQIGRYYKCYADRLNHLEINYDGRIYSCTARDFSDKQVVGVLDTTGKIVWDEAKRIKRYAKAPFENKMCLNCKYLPLCLGPCSQKIIETPKDKLENICNLHLTEISPETVIIDYYNKKMQLIKKCNDKIDISVNV